jgi:hypothetical protein
VRVEYEVELWFEGEMTPATLDTINNHEFFDSAAITAESTEEVWLTKLMATVDAYTVNDALNHVTAEALAALAALDFDGYLSKSTVTLL